jgi:uncharacterized protein YpiB (UPF0302 family)
MKRAIQIHIDETRELIRINEEHGIFMQLHFKELAEVMTHHRRREMAEIIDKIGEMVSRLQATVEGRKVLPTGWEELWASVKDAKALMESHRD